MKAYQRTAILFALGALAFGALSWKCVRDPKISFLPADRRAEWIVFPAAVDSRTHQVAVLDGTFRRVFDLVVLPKFARLEVRAASRVQLSINGVPVDTCGDPDWKNPCTIDVLRFLRVNQNTIEARVSNDTAPPAVWLAISSDKGIIVHSDKSWEASLAGSAWRTAAIASVARNPRPGNFMAGALTNFGVFEKIWPTWLMLSVVAALLSLAIQQFGHRINLIVFVILAGLFWLALFWNNLARLPFFTGFDCREHIAYIQYIQEKHRLPLPNEGFEMFQPPLFYLLSAAALWLCRLNVASDGAVAVLRLLTMLFGIANFVLTVLSVRLLFKKQIGAQVVALLVAAFLPMQLYLSHYATNETLAATLATATIYFALRVLQDRVTSNWHYLGLGFLAGAAMLTKATSILLLPPILLAFGFQFAKHSCPPRLWFARFGTMLAAWLATCGWHYVRIWQRFGNPLIGNWDPAVGFKWWQDPGFHTTGDYFRFGRALREPLFSGLNGFADGMYSTLWGDGLGGGLSDLLSLTPWNYDLMVGGYLLAIIPTALITIGIVVAAVRLIRSPSPQWLLLLSFSAVIALAILYMSLRVPSYAQVKSFYGLSALVPFCCFGALGWQKLTRQRTIVRFALGTLLTLWAFNSFGSFWIRNSPWQHIYGARKFYESKPERAISEAREAVKVAPSSAAARCFLAAMLNANGQTEDAIEQARIGLQLDSSAGDCHLRLAILLGKKGDTAGALAESRKALEAEPENALAYNVLFTCLRQSQRDDEAIQVARDALVVSPFDPELHYRLGLAAGQTGDFTRASNQFAYAMLLQPQSGESETKFKTALALLAKTSDGLAQLKRLAFIAAESPKMLSDLAWLLATNPDPSSRDGQEAVRLSERACTLTKRQDARSLATLAAAYAENEKFPAAIDAVQQSIARATATGESNIVTLGKDLLASFQANRPYRTEP